MNEFGADDRAESSEVMAAAHTHIPVQYHHRDRREREQDRGGDNRTTEPQSQTQTQAQQDRERARRGRGRQPRGAEEYRTGDRDRDAQRDGGQSRGGGTRGSQVPVQEMVYSTIPIALGQPAEALLGLASIQEVAAALDTVATGAGDSTAKAASGEAASRKSSSEEPVDVTVKWNFGGSTVFLARAGDDDWQGRRSMQQEYVSLYFPIHSISY